MLTALLLCYVAQYFHQTSSDFSVFFHLQVTAVPPWSLVADTCNKDVGFDEGLFAQCVVL